MIMNKPLHKALLKGKVFYKYIYVIPEDDHVFKTRQGNHAMFARF